MGRKRKGDLVSGWVVVDKPVGMGSTSVVSAVRRIFNAQKAGHAGTLDPDASGVLPIALGEATKTIPYVVDGSKTYAFTVRFGEATSTDDAQGEVIQTSDKSPTQEEIKAVLKHFIGEISQVPPKYSAIHVNGKRAYDLARENQEVNLAPRRIRINDLRFLSMPDEKTALFELDCEKGTYVRSVARDMAQMLGSCGHVIALRRLKCAKFSSQSAFLLENLCSLAHSHDWTGVLLPVETVLDDIPALALNEVQAQKLLNGGFLNLNDFPLVQQRFQNEKDEPKQEEGKKNVLQAKHNNRLMALVRVQDETIRPVRIILNHSTIGV